MDKVQEANLPAMNSATVMLTTLDNIVEKLDDLQREMLEGLDNLQREMREGFAGLQTQLEMMTRQDRAR